MGGRARVGLRKPLLRENGAAKTERSECVRHHGVPGQSIGVGGSISEPHRNLLWTG